MESFIELLNSSVITSLAIVLIVGIICGKLINKIKLPSVTGYIIGGILIGPFVLGLITHENIKSLSIINDIALGFIAFSIGSEFKKERLKKAGWKIIIVSAFEAFLAMIVTFCGLYFIGKQQFEFSLLAGAIASATAPAATIMVIKQYRAKGLMVDTLLQVVALDDAMAIIAFSIALAISQATLGNTGVNAMALLKPVIEIGGSLILGTIAGLILAKITNKSKTNENLFASTIATILVTVGLCLALELSGLIACMAIGAICINFSKSTRAFQLADGLTGPVFMAFFVVAGLDLDLSIILVVGVVGILYVLFRVVGKVAGASLGCALTKYPANVTKWLGVALIPQAGVAIGLSAIAQTTLAPYYPELASSIRTMILAATVIYELAGPVLAKFALTKAGTIANPKMKVKPH